MLATSNKKIVRKKVISKQPLVTIVTPSFNLIKSKREKTFLQMIESVRKQTYKNIEHIVVDGASNDGTLELLKEYQKKKWIKYYSEPDKGIYDAMNKGILKAKGKYVVCLNSDDFYCDEHAVEWLVEKAEEEGADACYGDARRVEPETLNFMNIWPGYGNFMPWKPQFPCHQTFLIKTEVMKELGLYDLQYKVCADNAFILRMVHHNKKFCFIRQCIITFRDGGFSNDNKDIVVKEKTNCLYDELGRYHGLTKEDCSNFIWNKFLKLPFSKAVKLGIKLDKEQWREQYFDILLDNMRKYPQKSELHVKSCKLSYKIFGFLPILNYKKVGGREQWKVLGLPLFKIRKMANGITTKYYILGLPVMKVSKK